ncbi:MULTISPECIES: 2-amino-4-hydroxy-6-hydroxymethyldihydropteridine diphosphokinase [unclassified Nostoc]|uniref:2-amino-4-hydroxy-6- hydroxymethyldihydropteridine diphosphokinase n=1 Tax=unclassified Nostoc TaxID=2593658 RepID=UPI000B95B445|nr:2-amino-4-hydroxy-6-hydroxymethyldihydropteridine diphosphokinase [Nostoc sp. 'Peltigera membranacea cyanobiont' 232]OYE00508.1 2-amino-4-hydroxy-6-hydroxymethyldihydropteridine diphosphokinase [Nostoc sp. 'Peltigera membranacea cyanobiont' 232]
MTRAAIGLGSNLGNSLATLKKALLSLNQTPGIKVITSSKWYYTKPVGPPQPDYLNGCAVLEVKETLSAEVLKDILMDIEMELGRVRYERWGARIIDLDLLLFENQVIETPTLQVPHPRLAERAFVLIPLLEIAAEWIEPRSGQTVLELAQKIDRSGIINHL